MSTVLETPDAFLAAFERHERERAGTAAPFAALRRAAIAHFAELGLPGTRHEEWRYTPLAPLQRTAWRRASAPARLDAATLAEIPRDGAAAVLVFVNGRYVPALSQPPAAPLRCFRLAELAAPDATYVESFLGRHAVYQQHALVALNTALFEDGVFLEVPRGCVVTQPLQIVYLTVPEGEPVMVHPRIFVLAEEQSELTLVETFIGGADGPYFNNPVTELVAASSAHVDHYRVQREHPDAVHIGTLHIRQERATTVRSHNVALGAGLARHNVTAVLAGEGGDCQLHGLYVLEGEQHVDNHLRVEHVAPHCSSREVYKGILDGASRGVFTGRIIVHKGAQKTDGKQTNNNLLLSGTARVDTKPQLEIFADDVKCTHGATIGQLDGDALFYLQSRGLAADVARGLLTYAFASASLEQIRLAPLQEQLRGRILARLPGAVRQVLA